jgi:hypothetical protein
MAICTLLGLIAVIACPIAPAMAQGPKGTGGDASDPGLWGNVRYGMTSSQVHRLVPSSHLPEQEDQAIDRSLSELLVADGQLEGRRVEARFYFSDDRLLLVIVHAEGDDLDQSYVNRLANHLTAKYGSPSDSDLKSEFGEHCTWPSPYVFVTMLALLPIHPNMKFRLPSAGNSVDVNYISPEYYSKIHRSK